MGRNFHRFQRARASRRGRPVLLAGVMLLVLFGGRGVTDSLAGVDEVVAPHWDAPRPNRVVAVGDTSCWPIHRSERWCRMEEVAPLAETSDLLLLLGDIAQDAGRPVEYERGFDPTWGHLVGRSFPVPGNHDYVTPGAVHYYAYFGERAGQPGRGFYSVDLAGWRVYALNSNCDQVGCEPGSLQWRWLRSALRTDPGCSLAMLHHPLRSSVAWFDPAAAAPVEPLYRLLVDARVPLVLAGHAHLYERIALGRDTQLIIAGTGGYGLHDLAPDARTDGSLAAIDGTFGVLELRLHDRSYTSAFLPVEGGRRDLHRGRCGSDQEGPAGGA